MASASKQTPLPPKIHWTWAFAYGTLELSPLQCRIRQEWVRDASFKFKPRLKLRIPFDLAEADSTTEVLPPSTEIHSWQKKRKKKKLTCESKISSKIIFIRLVWWRDNSIARYTGRVGLRVVENTWQFFYANNSLIYTGCIVYTILRNLQINQRTQVDDGYKILCGANPSRQALTFY